MTEKNGEYFVRLKKIELFNFKNIEEGTINLFDLKENREQIKSNIIGLYGQNGSGKTSVVEALSVLKDMLSGEVMGNDFSNYIMVDKESFELKLEFYVEIKEHKYLVFYNFELKRGLEEILINKEEIYYKKYLENDRWDNKKAVFIYKYDETKKPFRPINKFNDLMNIKDDIDMDFELRSNKKTAKRERRSYIFFSENMKLYDLSGDFLEYKDLIYCLNDYGKKKLQVVTNIESGFIYTSLFIPFTYSLDNSPGNVIFDFDDNSELSYDDYKTIGSIINQINKVLKYIVPGLYLKTKLLNEFITKEGEKKAVFDIISNRNDKSFSFRYESDGIKKIVSTLSLLIAMYNDKNSCIVIDEFDSGVYEYLLGEIIDILNKKGKGQFIFTSHNLRPLEVLNSKNIIFTTVNPQNRYIKINNIKTNHNLRNQYYRTIILGGQKEELYDETNEYKIALAFKKAGEIIED
jgi:AAA15 family ATPase/GTPase